MDWKLELVAVPVSDVDRAKAFYADQVGFNARPRPPRQRRPPLRPDDTTRLGLLDRDRERLTDAAPGSVGGLQIVVSDVTAARAELEGRGVDGVRGPGVPVGQVRLLQRPGRQRLGAPGAAAAPLNHPGSAYSGVQ